MNRGSKLATLLLLGVFCCIALSTQAGNDGKDFTQKEKEAANVAVNTPGLSSLEKEIYYYLNLARTAPKTFAQKYVKDYKGDGYMFAERQESLYQQLMAMKPIARLVPDRALIETAVCFATQAGQAGLEGHSRKGTSCKEGFEGECCAYGKMSALANVIELLVDLGMGNEDLGHRKIMLDPAYRTMGCAERDHKVYEKNLVLDFGSGGKGNLSQDDSLNLNAESQGGGKCPYEEDENEVQQIVDSACESSDACQGGGDDDSDDDDDDRSDDDGDDDGE